MGLEAYFVDIVTMVPLVLLITEFLTSRFPKLDGLPSRIASFVVSEAIVFAGFFAGFSGVLAGIEAIWLVAAYGIAVGLVANGVFSTDTAKWFLEFLKARVPKSEPS